MSDRPTVHLAQYNIAVLRHPMEHPDNRSFEDLLDETNRLAEASPGFVWRHGIDSRHVDDTAYDDPHVLVNASVWESFEQLRDYAFRGWHRDVFKRRAEWFVDSAATMWWVPAGHVPSLHECVARLAFQHRHGPSPYAFGMNEKHARLVIEQSARGSEIRLVARIDGHDAGGVTVSVARRPVAEMGILEEHHPTAHWLADMASVLIREQGCTSVILADGSSRPVPASHRWPPD